MIEDLLDDIQINPVELGRRLAALYEDWCDRPGFNLVDVAQHLVARLGCLDSSVGRSCLEVAAAVQAWGGYPYHSAFHHGEVALNVTVLVALATSVGTYVRPHEQGILLVSALSHDLYYVPNSGEPRFGQEWRSATAMDGMAARCGLAREDRQAIIGLILATAPHFRTELLPGRRGTSEDNLPQPLIALMRSPSLKRMATILSDADLLSSAGLTEAWHHVQVQRLQREMGREIQVAEDVLFFETVVGSDLLSVGGRHFSANVARIRAAVAAAARSPPPPIMD